MLGVDRGLDGNQLVCFVPRQLQHGGDLTGDQSSQLDDRTIREFDGIVMRVRIVEFDLPEAGEAIAC